MKTFIELKTGDSLWKIKNGDWKEYHVIEIHTSQTTGRLLIRTKEGPTFSIDKWFFDKPQSLTLSTENSLNVYFKLLGRKIKQENIVKRRIN